MKCTSRRNKPEEIDWREVYDELLPRVFHYFYYKVGDVCIAEELAAITFEKTWKNRKKYNLRLGKLRFYIFGIAKNVVVDYFRRKHDEIQLEDVAGIPGGKTVEEQVERNSNHHRIAELVAALSERERNLISLKYGSGMTNREIARFTGLSESNVGTILHRTVVKLREKWEKFE